MAEDQLDGPYSARCVHDNDIYECSLCAQYKANAFFKSQEPRPVTLEEAVKDFERSYESMGGWRLNDDDDIKIRLEVFEWLLGEAEDLKTIKAILSESS